MGDPRGVLAEVGDVLLWLPKGFRLPPAKTIRPIDGRSFIPVPVLKALIASDNQPQETPRRGADLLDHITAVTQTLTTEQPRRAA